MGSSKSKLFLVALIVLVAASLGCGVGALPFLATETPVPTATLVPTQTPYPTYTPLPTYTPFPTSTPAGPDLAQIQARIKLAMRGASTDENCQSDLIGGGVTLADFSKSLPQEPAPDSFVFGRWLYPDGKLCIANLNYYYENPDSAYVMWQAIDATYANVPYDGYYVTGLSIVDQYVCGPDEDGVPYCEYDVVSVNKEGMLVLVAVINYPDKESSRIAAGNFMYSLVEALGELFPERPPEEKSYLQG